MGNSHTSNMLEKVQGQIDEVCRLIEPCLVIGNREYVCRLDTIYDIFLTLAVHWLHNMLPSSDKKIASTFLHITSLDFKVNYRLFS